MVLAHIENPAAGVRIVLDTTTGLAHSKATDLSRDARERIQQAIALALITVTEDMGTENDDRHPFRRAADLNTEGMGMGQNP